MKKLVYIFLVLMVIFLGLFSCGKKAETVITIPLVTWGGYASLFAANNGASPTEDSLFYKYGKFKVKLIQVEDPALQLTGFAKGDYQMIWSTVDMVPLIYESLAKDPNTIPKIIGLFDYSAGGDGIIVRGNINSGADLKGKKIVTSQYTPSHFFLLWFLNENGISTKDVQIIPVADAIVAKNTYVADSKIDACVTWSPFIYDITDPGKSTYVSGSKLLITTNEDNKAFGVIADVILARKDFVEKNPQIMEAFTKALIDGYEVFIQDKTKAAGQIADLFGLKGGADEVMIMFDDVVIGNKEETKKFFDKSNKFSVYNLIKFSEDLYKNEGKLSTDYKLNPEDVVESKFILKAVQ